MISNVYRFIQFVQSTMLANPRYTMIQARDVQFNSMSRSELLKLRASCYTFAEDITAHLCWLDCADERASYVQAEEYLEDDGAPQKFGYDIDGGPGYDERADNVGYSREDIPEE